MKTKILFSILLISIITSCKKNDVGGDASVVAHIKHHSTPIKGATLYVKFKAQDLPSDPTNNYDLKIEGDPAEDHVHIEELRPGNYYLYATGWDSTISDDVVGGVALKIKWSERKDDIEIDVPVTE
jgi:hypothetical protein